MAEMAFISIAVKTRWMLSVKCYHYYSQVMSNEPIILYYLLSYSVVNHYKKTDILLYHGKQEQEQSKCQAAMEHYQIPHKVPKIMSSYSNHSSVEKTVKNDRSHAMVIIHTFYALSRKRIYNKTIQFCTLSQGPLI